LGRRRRHKKKKKKKKEKKKTIFIWGLFVLMRSGPFETARQCAKSSKRAGV
jgi:hypothetical protein